ncbi:MAG: hypothetical protein N5P05_000593 [Chroococcopsis gigantea SAG 12.99]|jgi:hypothetical protein|nr:DUF2358 domain-containing protein [Chlorogloea purpurea SAG 13.99]MDV2998987.1 hypothetical protein [Chroococcopsis gigantea SAG 12.99]
MTIIDILKSDYGRFPQNQTYDIYAPDVYFKDPLNEFRGIKRYQQMIGFMTHWFREINMELFSITQEDEIIHTRWCLHWTTPLPWQPRVSIPGRSELRLNGDNLIVSHVDYWDCSPWDVIKQHFR